MRNTHEIIEGLRCLIAEYDRANAQPELKTEQMNFRCRPSFREHCATAAERRGISVAEFIERAVLAYDD